MPVRWIQMTDGQATELAANRSLESAVALAIARARGLSDSGESVLGAIGDKLGLRAGLLWRIDTGRRRMSCVTSWAADPGVAPFLAESSNFAPALDDDVPGPELASGRVVWRPDVWSDERYQRREHARRHG